MLLVGVVSLLLLLHSKDSLPDDISGIPAVLVSAMYTKLDFENITNSVLSGTAIEADMGPSLELLLDAIPLSTPALKGFNCRIAPIDVAVGVGSTSLSESGDPRPPPF